MERGKDYSGGHCPNFFLLPMRYSQVLNTQVAFVPVGDVVRPTNRQVCDGAGDGHQWVLLVNAAVHLRQTQENVLLFSQLSS